jgi:hypothetical protein
MDREELIEAINKGPVRVRMNDGSAYEIEKPEFATVADLTLSVLHRNQEGKLKHVLLPLVTMVAVEPIEVGA